jgi:diguanylate cyclase (GGDEF)-like protein/PAS domain S-box-containing protein
MSEHKKQHLASGGHIDGIDSLLTMQDEQRHGAPAALLAAALTSMSSAIFITNANGIILWVNDAFTRLSGYSSLEAVGRTPAILNSGSQDRAYYALLWETILAGHVWQGEVIDRHKSGTLYVIDEIITPLFDRHGVASHFIAIQHDITLRKHESERDRYLAYHDVLTGLPNRASFLSILQLAISRASRDASLLALMFIDLDKFKPVNDEFGHRVGDQLLAAVGARLRGAIRKSDVVARIGGDEFVVLLHDKVTRALASRVATKLLGTLARQFMVSPHRLSIGGSIGLAFYPDDGLCVEEMMVNADAAMYQAKIGGGGAFRCCHPAMARAGPSAGKS